jgi:integrase
LGNPERLKRYAASALEHADQLAGLTSFPRRAPGVRGGNRGDQVCGERMSEKVVWQMLKTYIVGAGLPNLAPHDLRRTTAKLCRAAGGELEQIQLLLGHSSVQTTERYLGTKQDLAHAPNDGIKLKLAE